MKKTVLYFLLMALTVFNAKGQFAKNWEKTAIAVGTNPVPANGYSWLTLTAANINSCAYNPVTKKLYVANRGVDINIINPLDGSFAGTLSKIGITVGSFDFHKVRVTPTGEIFAATLKTSTGNGVCNVYYWANEIANPIIVSADIVLANERAGDAFAVTGSGNDAVMYFGGSGTSNLQVVNKVINGGFVKINNIVLPAVGAARSSIAPVTTGITSDVWVSGATVAKRKLSSTGVVIKALADNLLVGGAYTSLNSISNKFSSLEYFEVGAKQFLAATGAHDSPISGEGQAFHIYDITNVNNVLLIASSKLVGTYNANTAPTADIAVNKVLNGDGTYKVDFFQLVNHNGIASYSLNFEADGTLPVSLSSFNAALVNGTSKLSWSTTSESNNSGFEIQRSVDGKDFVTLDFVPSNAAQGNSSAIINYTYEDKTAVSGTQYYRLKQLDLNGDFAYSEIKALNLSLNEAQVKIYPNPVGSVLILSVPAELTGSTYQVYGLSGKEILNGRVGGTTEISVADLAPATYFIKISNKGKEIESLKFIRQ